MTAATDWGLWVDEVGIFASGIGADRWMDFLAKANRGRLAILGLTPAGGEYHVMCGPKADALEAYEIFAEVGFHKAHVKVARLSACQARAAERKRRVDEVFGPCAPDGGRS